MAARGFDGGMTSIVSGPTRSGVAVRNAAGVSHREPRLRDAAGVRLGIAHALLLLAVPVVSGAGVVTADVVLVVLAGAACTTLPRRVSMLTGVVAWAWATGFAENSYGVLTFSPADLVRLAVSATGCLLVALPGRRVLRAAHWLRGRRA